MGKWFARKQRPQWSTVLRRSELEQLATYNSERARGIVHTEAWQAEMAELQRRFDWAMRPRFEVGGDG